MFIAPKSPGLTLNTTMSIVNTFIKIREVTDDIACLSLGNRLYAYRGIISVNPVNLAFMAEEDQEGLIEGFKSFLNGISFPIQILIRNRLHNLDHYTRTMRSVQGDLASMAHDHADFVEELASHRVLIEREFYIIVPADKATSSNRTEALINAQMQLKLRIEELIRQLERMGLPGRRLTTQEIIELYQKCYMPVEARTRPLTSAMIDGTIGAPMTAGKSAGASSPVQLSGTGVAAFKEEQEMSEKQKKKKQSKKKKNDDEKLPEFVDLTDLLTPSCIQIFPSFIRIDGETEQVYTRTFSLVSYPRSAYPGWLSNIISIDDPEVDFSVHIVPLSPERVNARLGRKATQFRGAVMTSARQGRSPDPNATIALEDVEELQEKLARGDERVFNVSVHIQVRGRDRRELNERSNRVASLVRSLDFRMLPTHWQHHMGFLSCLPDLNNQINRSRLFGTSAVATFFPFVGNTIGMETGVMLGIAPHSGPIILNPFNSQQLENANLVVFAKSGAGKSFFLKTITSRLLPTCNVYAIDPEAEYQLMCQHVQGQQVRLSSNALQINPLELYGQASSPGRGGTPATEESNFFREKLLNLITLLELMLSDEGSLPQKEKSFLYRCLIKTYANRGITMDPVTHNLVPPNMHELYMIMSSVRRGDQRFGVGEDTFGLSERLERYLHLFPGRTRVALDNRFIDFNIRELSDSLKPIGLFLVTEFLWTKMRQARQARVLEANSIILIDEAWLLMQFPQGAKFLEELARRIRKYGGGLWCTTQNSDDFLGSEEGKTILAMSTMKFLMKQDSSTIDSVTQTFRLSLSQKKFLLSARRGEGLFATRSWTQMEVVASPREAEMANTTLQTSLSQLELRTTVVEDRTGPSSSLEKERSSLLSPPAPGVTSHLNHH